MKYCINNLRSEYDLPGKRINKFIPMGRGKI